MVVENTAKGLNLLYSTHPVDIETSSWKALACIKPRIKLDFKGIITSKYIQEMEVQPGNAKIRLILFDLILNIPVNNFFSYVGMGLPVLSQY